MERGSSGRERWAGSGDSHIDPYRPCASGSHVAVVAAQTPSRPAVFMISPSSAQDRPLSRQSIWWLPSIFTNTFFGRPPLLTSKVVDPAIPGLVSPSEDVKLSRRHHPKSPSVFPSDSASGTSDGSTSYMSLATNFDLIPPFATTTTFMDSSLSFPAPTSSTGTETISFSATASTASETTSTVTETITTTPSFTQPFTGPPSASSSSSDPGTTLTPPAILSSSSSSTSTQIPTPSPVNPVITNPASLPQNDSARSSSHIGAIVGGSIAGAVVLIAAVLLALYFRQRTRRRHHKAPSAEFMDPAMREQFRPMLPPPHRLGAGSFYMPQSERSSMSTTRLPPAAFQSVFRDSYDQGASEEGRRVEVA
ncbi:hypothetical protein BV25DRAFT_279305 [Artomyces pyxidatus]|uniref:Uncharacterized protein n=1 Tax=Artomyces pyxidatus TaxID=48021 RepID=A0ACB8T843_9AGAM|nr:hypothetical protein BV25DRAFT_279305 [Artomyces pyxidatus]